MSALPRVVIVGRANVGKSTLFNRLSVDVKSMAYDFEGVTRDFIKDVVCWQDRCFELIDTGGISLKASKDLITEQVRQGALKLLETSDVIVFVCDGKIGVLPEDRAIAKTLHKLGKTVLLAVNKIDAKIAQEQVYEFDRLGFKQTIPLSAQHGTGIADLLEDIVHNLPQKKKMVEQEPTSKVVILGRPNVGKSSLLNLLLKQERAIVANVPGTTREPITEQIQFFKAPIELTDTAGVRKPRSVKEPLEKMMVESTLRAVQNADIILLMVDASEAHIADQELKLAFYAFERQYKAVIILFNKTDLLDDYTKAQLEHDMERYEHLLKKVVTMNISCKTGDNVGKILKTVAQVNERYNQHIDGMELFQFFKEALHRKPLYRNQQLLHVLRVEQVASAPMTLLLKVNEPKWFGPSQLGYFDNLLRKKYDLKGVPIRFLVRKK